MSPIAEIGISIGLGGNPVATIKNLQREYESLTTELGVETETAIESSCLIVFDYEHQEYASRVEIDTEEFTAVCPWTGLPDFGTLEISYVPNQSCVELKSLKYYLMSYRNVGIVQEHAAGRILDDLVNVCHPAEMTVELDYGVRGGIHTRVIVNYPK